MRHALQFFVLLALLAAPYCLSGCQSGGGSVTTSPLTAEGSANGDSTGPQVKLFGQPVTALVKIHGEVQYTIQPFPPYVTLDGDYTIIVEPIQGREHEAQMAVRYGHLLIRRNGQPAQLNAPGSIRAFKAATASMKAYRLAPPSSFPPANTAPIGLATFPPPSSMSTAEPEINVEPCVCRGADCPPDLATNKLP